MCYKSRTPRNRKIFQKDVNNCNKRFEFYHLICKWTLQFVGTTTYVKSKRMYSNGSRCGLIRYLLKKIESFGKKVLIFSRILEMNITFITSLDLMTYEQYLNQPMQMVERVLNKKIIKKFGACKIVK